MGSGYLFHVGFPFGKPKRLGLESSGDGTTLWITRSHHTVPLRWLISYCVNFASIKINQVCVDGAGDCLRTKKEQVEEEARQRWGKRTGRVFTGYEDVGRSEARNEGSLWKQEKTRNEFSPRASKNEHSSAMGLVLDAGGDLCWLQAYRSAR